MSETWVIAGLGNPGRSYASSRHNAGYMVLERLAEELRADPFREKWGAEVAAATLSGRRILLARSQDFMNSSGRALAKVCSFYDAPPDRLVAIHDDLDLPLGVVKVKTGGGHGGHNGLKSLDQSLGANGYHRIRVGIGRPGEPSTPGTESSRSDGKQGAVVGYVLGSFSGAERTVLDDALRTATEAAIAVVVDGATATMNRYNGTKTDKAPNNRRNGPHK